MELYTIKGLDKILVEGGYINDLHGQNDFMFYDKCNWLITSVIRKNYAIKSEVLGYVNIHSGTLRKLLGRDYKSKYINTLNELKIIKVNDIYSSKNFSKSYTLTNYAQELGTTKTKIHSSRFSKAIDQYLNDKFQKIYSNPLFRKILDNLSRLKVKGSDNDFLHLLIDPDNVNDFKIERYLAYYKDLKRLNESSNPRDIFLSNISFEPRLSKHGRVYHLGASIPKLIRRILVTKQNEQIYEVDMSSAQFSLLIMCWASEHPYYWECSKKFQNEYNRNIELVANGGVYDYISKNSKPFKDLEYSKLKLTILTTLNAKQNSSIYNIELKRLFPAFMNWVNSKKKNNSYESISHLGQYLESSLFVETYKELPNEIFSLIIHDSILTTIDNASVVKDKLQEKLLKIFSNYIFDSKESLNGLFKIQKVSIDEQEYEDFKLELYSKDWYENFGQYQIEDDLSWFDTSDLTNPNDF